MMKSLGLFIAGAVFSLSCTAAQANDTMATIGTTGIQFTKSDAIEMKSEDLFISKDFVTVKYEFFNTSDRDVTGTVSFPLPAISNMIPYSIAFTKTEGKELTTLKNPFEFVLHVNGKETPVTLDTRTSGECEGPCEVSYNYHWQQTFPAKKSVVIEHRYRTGYGNAEDDRSIQKDYCISAEQFETLRTQSRQNYDRSPAAAKDFGDFENYFISQTVHYQTQAIAYILQTAKNWRGPIGHFKLTIDKGTSSALMSLCWPHQFTQVSPTQYVFEQDNFVPEQDLKILLMSPTQ